MSDSKSKGGKPGSKSGGKSAAPRGAGGPPAKIVKGAGRGESLAMAAPGPAQASPETAPRLQVHYLEVIRAAMQKEFGYTNPMQVPRLQKIVINMGVGEATADQKKLDAAVGELALISAQKPIKTVAKKAIAGFKIRKGLPIGCKVTLRKARMYEFLDRLVTIALPRVRDFRGLTDRSFDGHGNYALGIKEHLIFPEIDYDKIDRIWGMDVVVCTSADRKSVV